MPAPEVFNIASPVRKRSEDAFRVRGRGVGQDGASEVACWFFDRGNSSTRCSQRSGKPAFQCLRIENWTRLAVGPLVARSTTPGTPQNCSLTYRAWHWFSSVCRANSQRMFGGSWERMDLRGTTLHRLNSSLYEARRWHGLKRRGPLNLCLLVLSRLPRHGANAKTKRPLRKLKRGTKVPKVRTSAEKASAQSRGNENPAATPAEEAFARMSWEQRFRGDIG